MATPEVGSRPSEQPLSGPVKREHPSQISFLPAWYIDQNRRFWETAAELARPVLTPPEWTTPNTVELERKNVILRNFTDGISSNEPPILILPPQAGHTSAITDFGPNQSLVEVAIQSGAPVYACDWPEATYERRTETIDDFIKVTDACVDAASKDGKPVTLVGLCQGGWQAAIYTALYPQKVDRLILAGAPIDFHAGNSQITNYARILPISYYEALVASGNGNMPGEYMLAGFKLLDPYGKFVRDPTELFIHIDDPVFRQRHRTFNNWYDHPQDIPGAFFLQAVDLFKENRLIKGKLEVLGTRVDLKQITCPVTLLAGKKDEITPPVQLFNATNYLGSTDIRMYLVDAGHIGLFMSHNALMNFWPDMLKSQTARSDNETAA